MSEKRYMLSDFDSEVEMLEKLNELLEENEQLKKQINELVKGIQDSAKISADAMCKRMNKNVWDLGLAWWCCG